jgi:hypothetical protein
MRWTATFAGAVKSESISRSFGSNVKVARPVRVELTTYSFGGCRSIHLSYGRTVAFHRKGTGITLARKLRRVRLF